jgi:hypothetical protein
MCVYALKLPKGHREAKLALVNADKRFGVVVFSKDTHAALKDIRPAIFAAYTIYNLLGIDQALKENRFGYSFQLEHFLEEDLELLNDPGMID